MTGGFEWDSAKAESNIAKHGVSFEEAATVWADVNAVFVDDGSGTGRVVAIGFSEEARLLMVVHVEVDGDIIRIISARPATKTERRIYQEG